MSDARWPAGTASGVGSLPGTEPAVAWQLVLDTVPDFPFLPELPARGPGADMIGRGVAVCRELPVDLQPTGWRLVARPGMDSRRGADLLARDLDAAEDALAGYTGPVGVAVCGPWTLAASVELGRGGAALADTGAVRDLGDALTEGVVTMIGELRRRIPGGRLVVSFDEPSLPAVLAGRIRTASGLSVVAAVPADAVRARLSGLAAAVAAADAVSAVHCCAPRPPLRVFREAGMRAVGGDLGLIGEQDLDDLGECIDSGVGLTAGVVPTSAPAAPDSGAGAAARRVLDLWSRLGFPRAELCRSVVVTPTCGLAGAAPDVARRTLQVAAAAARELVDRSEQ